MTDIDLRQQAAERELAVGLERVEILPDGARHWHEVFFAHVMGHRPLAMTLSVPPGVRRAPLVIYIHGGGWMMGHRNVQHPNLAAMNLFDNLVDAGYAVARISYRLSAEAQFPAQLHDCKAAVRYLRQNADLFGIDSDRIAALGESAGGHLAMLLGLALPPELEGAVGVVGPSSRVQAVVNWYGIADFNTIAEHAGPDAIIAHDSAQSAIGRLIGGAISQHKAIAAQASPITHVSSDAAPCLTQHGAADRVVPMAQGAQYHAALMKAGVPTAFDIVSNADHCFVGGDTGPLMERVITFLDHHLK